MTLTQTLTEHIAACFTGLWIRSCEHDDALAEIGRLCQAHNWPLATWDIDAGLRLPGSTATPSTPADPLAAIRALPALAKADSSALLVLVNFHRFLGAPETVQALAHQLTAGKHQRTFVLVLSPVVNIPAELERLFAVIEHDLPDRAQLEAVARSVATQPGDLPDGPELATILDAAAGLTRLEAEGAFSLALVRHNRVQPQVIWELKAQALKKTGLLALHRGGETFADLGGLEALKGFCRRALRTRPSDHPARPRGILLLSPPGCGKSAFAKALGSEVGRPTVVLDVGALMGSLVGQTESNVRQALRMIDLMAPCVVFVDELEKAFAGLGSTGDSGVASRMFGSLLTWLSDHESDVFVVCTSNDISRLPPEFSRAERFDAVFFVDLPSAVEKQAIWAMYLRRYGLEGPPAPKLPADEGWTGAEIRSCCRLAALLDVSLAEAARHVVPVAVTNAEAVTRLRDWASGRCLSAYQPGLYVRNATGAATSGRRVTRGRLAEN